MNKIIYWLLCTVFGATQFCLSAGSIDCKYDSLHVKQCKNVSLSSIDTLKNDCLVANHLMRFKNYIEENAVPCSTAVDLMKSRYKTLTDKKVFPIDYSNIQWFGDTNAPVSILLYISMSCPHCKMLYQELYDTLRMEPALRRKVRLGIKYRSSTRYDKMLAVTAELGKQPDFLRHCSEISERIDDEVMKRILRLMSVSYDSLESRANSPEIDSLITRSRQESIGNGVKYTPAIFINKRVYGSIKRADLIFDAVDYIQNEKKSSAKK